MNPPKAFLFDLNGTMIDDMNYHIAAWHNILNNLGANLTLEKVQAECYGKNGELLERVFPGRYTEQEKNELGFDKEKVYQAEYRSRLKLIDGLHEFLEFWHAKGIKMAIGSAAIMFNIDFVLDGLDIRRFFDVIVSADDVHLSKPHPETYLKAAELLKQFPEDCLVFEDNPKGVESANNAGMNVVVITSMHQPHEFEGYHNIIAFADDYKNLQLPYTDETIKTSLTNTP